MEYGKPHVVGREPPERLTERLDRALHVGLEHHLQLLHLASLDLLVELVERDLGGLCHLGFALLPPAMLCHLAGLLIVLHGDEDVTGFRHAAETEDLHRRRWLRRLDAAALVVHHGAAAAVLRASPEGVARLDRALPAAHRGDRPAPAAR